MDKVTMAARLLLGLIFVVMGLNGFFQFIEAPPFPRDCRQFPGNNGWQWIPRNH